METEVAVKFEAHDHEIKSLKYRVTELEVQVKSIQDLVISVNKMAVNMENMVEEQKKQGIRLEALEKVPAETNRQVKTAIINVLVGGIVGAFVTALLTII